MKTTRIIALALLGLSILNRQLSTAFAQGSAFTYEGRLSDNGAPATGSYDLQFTIYDSLTGGSVVGGPIFNRPTDVSNGLFTVTLDFGAGAFTGPPRFLEIGVRTNGSDLDHTPLSPRQPITATPYAITAGNLTGTLQATQLTGVLASAQLGGTYSGAVTFSNAANSFSGSGSGLTNVNAKLLEGLDSSAFWKLLGNSNTIPGTHFLGTRDNQPLELHVNRQRALRLEPNTNGAPNLIGGSPLNGVDAGVVGAAIGGGGATNFGGSAYSNRVSGSFGAIAGGGQNTIQTNAFAATIAGGFENTIQTNSFYSTVGGGRFNTNGARFATIGGGTFNTIQTNAVLATIGGGGGNAIQTNASSSTIGGGSSNTNGGRFATVPGGNANAAMADYSFAAGRQAKANHDGAFVWADSTAADFASTANNQFLIRASGGVGIGKTNPVTALDVNGIVTASTFTGSGGGLSNVNASSVAAGAVTTAALADGAVTAAKVATVSNWFALTIANPTPASGDSFGLSLAAVGTDRMLIGARYDDTGASDAGAAYLFSTNGALLTTFTNPTPAADDQFGVSVAAVGSNRVLIGAYQDDTGATDAGAAYLFSTNGALLTTFTNPTPAAGEVFGGSVAALGIDRVLIGASGDHTGATNAGAAYLFSTNGTLLTTFTNPTPASNDLFGVSVAAMGSDRVLIGASHDNTGASHAGAAYLFSTNGALLTTFTNPAPGAARFLGDSVAAVGTDRVLIGAPEDGTVRGGAAYLFSTNGALLTSFTNPISAGNGFFGASVAAMGSDRVLIGANADADPDAAYLFSTNGMLLTTFTSPTPAIEVGFGEYVAALGTGRVLIGAPGADTGAINAGAAYLFSTESYTPGLVADGINARSIITSSLEDGAVTAAKIGGVLFPSQIPDLDASKITSGTVPDARLAGNIARTNQVWLLGGNSGTSAGANFLGTTDNQPLELKVNGQRALRLEPTTNGGPNVIGGSPFNLVDAGVFGATISGGGVTNLNGVASSNHVSANFGTIGGGRGNSIQADARSATIGGGENNTIRTNADRSTIGGGEFNTIKTNVEDSTIGGGDENTIEANADFATIGGGEFNMILTNAHHSTIAGGGDNSINGNASHSTIGGGSVNAIGTNADYSTIAGGDDNRIHGNASQSTIGGGGGNAIGGRYATIPGGTDNDATGDYSFAAGRQAKANHDGAFVWADSIAADFASTASNQFLIRASGGVGIGTNAPATALHVNGNVTATSFLASPGSAFPVGYGFQGDLDTGMFTPGINTLAFAAAGNERMRIESGGNVGIGTNNPSAKLHVIGGITCTALTQTSDRNAKEHFQPVSAAEVLEKVAVLPITRWNFKELHDGQHLGPMAQDFHAAFGLGASDTTITALDEQGVALAAIQGLNQKLEEQKAELKQKQTEITELKRELGELKHLVDSLAGKLNGGAK